MAFLGLVWKFWRVCVLFWSFFGVWGPHFGLFGPEEGPKLSNEVLKPRSVGSEKGGLNWAQTVGNQVFLLGNWVLFGIIGGKRINKRHKGDVY